MSRGAALRRLAAYEGRWLVSLGWWVARRRIGVAPGERALAYAGPQTAFVYGLAFVCVVESVGVSVLLADHPVAHAVMLVLDVYTVLVVLGLQAAAVTRPHVLGAETLWLRAGARRDVRIPLELIASVRYDLRFVRKTEKDANEVLELVVGDQTSVTVELSEPVVAVGLLGRRETVRTVRFHADDARAAVTALRAQLAAVHAGTEEGTGSGAGPESESGPGPGSGSGSGECSAAETGGAAVRQG
ncbi:hypothetical protein RM550_32605 [Streptomyces sp. DSM 41527]|uniref:Integral membrane protein n=1 Tax=Streptomyces mooreae TaxID=3075523 RepID=A0ABU2THJ9_9ACTN|nr:hypothetical protein [Streptomyces sp. DSM 41527]MDT0460408.1 hypothetical protein [Streptomyces sp. DSM 41527]